MNYILSAVRWRGCYNLTRIVKAEGIVNRRVAAIVGGFRPGRQMAQKSITAFFSKAPSRESGIKNNSNKAILKEENSIKDEPSSSPNEKIEKKTEKRQRLESKSSGSETPVTSPDTAILTSASQKKNNRKKRLRIESSSSETELDSKNVAVKGEGSPSPKKKELPSAAGKVKSQKKEKHPSEETNTGASQEDAEAKVFATNGQGDKVEEAAYDPGKAKYDPLRDACWARGEPVPYLALARTLEAVEATSARLQIVRTLSNYLRSVLLLTPEDLLPSVYMCLNRLAPAHRGLELGVADTYLMKAVGQCTGRTLAQVRAAAQRTGDLGLVAEQARATQRTMFAAPPLQLRKVLAALRDVARMSGQASVNKKIARIQSLYVACRHCEARYLIRSLAGKLRIGLAEQSVLQALALAAATTPPAQPWPPQVLDASRGLAADAFKARVEEHALVLKAAYCECPDFEVLMPALLAHGVLALPEHCRLTPGLPLKPMLAHPTRGLDEIFQRFEGVAFTCEWKYDGERAQLHVAPELGGARIFSRNQEDHTGKYPDVLARLPALLSERVHSCVLDCEAVAYDPARGQILPFQVLSTRKRKEAAAHDVKVQVCLFVFDLLYLNGRPLVREPLAERRRLLREHFREAEGQWQFARGRDCERLEDVAEFLEEALRGSCEGLMVKTLSGRHATYDIAKRSHNWLKLKKDYLEGAGDSIDVVVVGGYHGRGKRAGVFGGFLLAAYDPDSEHFQSLCKIGTGFSDEDLRTLGDALRQHAIAAPPAYYSYDASHAPDVWFASACVWEVRCADLSLSPAHRAAIGLVEADKGISLRFPRFVRVREDKAPEQATSARQLADMYLAQDQVRNQKGAGAAAAGAADDYY